MTLGSLLIFFDFIIKSGDFMTRHFILALTTFRAGSLLRSLLAAPNSWQKWTLLGLLIVAALLVLWLLLSLVFIPIFQLLNRLLSRADNSTIMPQQDLLLGTLTLGVSELVTGEVMISGSGRARQTYAAKLYQPDQEADLAALPKGSRVVVVTVIQGVAYVIPFQEPTTKLRQA